jgi:Domain of unknown function (DUF4159)
MRWRIAVTVVLLAVAASVAAAQFQRRGGRGGFYSFRGLPFATMEEFDGSFQFCRIAYTEAADGDGGGWSVDYPRADENLSIRLSELTRTHVGMDSQEVPKHLLINLRQPELFHCPFIMMTEVGRLSLNDQEAANLRTYLVKGGFLWADDFWGEYAWDFFENQLRRALPRGEFPIIDLPLDHPLFHELMAVNHIPQIPSINAWGGPGGRTSERGAESATPHARAILDGKGRVMVFITHNTDFGDAFEREGDNHEYFIEFSVPGYAVGVNVLLYAMTH